MARRVIGIERETLLRPIRNLVVTDEVGMGRDAAHLRQRNESLMHRGHDLWLATLKRVSENNSNEE